MRKLIAILYIIFFFIEKKYEVMLHLVKYLKSNEVCWNVSNKLKIVLSQRWSYKSSHTELFYKKSTPKNFKKLTRIHHCWYVFLNKYCKLKIGGLQLYQKWTPALVFSCDFCAIFENTYMAEHLWTPAKEVTNFEKATDPVHQKNSLW